MLESLFNLKGRTALITGGSKGIGKAIARGFAEAGADIAICSRHESELVKAADEIKQGLSTRVWTTVADLAKRENAEALSAWALKTCGKVDILVNNAGSNKPQTLIDTTFDTWDEILQLNFTSCMQVARAVAPGMAEAL